MAKREQPAKLLIDEECSSSSNIVIDRSWVKNYYERHCLVDFEIIAGSRDSALCNKYDEKAKKPSVQWIKKKTR